MKKLRRIALSLLLTCVATLSASAKSPTTNSSPIRLNEYLNNYSPQQAEVTRKYLPLPPPETMEDHVNFFDNKITEESKRENALFRYQNAQDIISKYNAYDYRRPQIFHDTFFPTEEEEKTVRRASIKTIKEAFKETRRASPEIKNIEGEMLSFLHGYYLSLKGPNTNGHTGIPTLDEETREETIKRKSKMKILEETVTELGKKYRIEFKGKFNYSINGITPTKLIQGPETEATLSDFQVLNQRFHKLRIRAKADQEVKVNLTKLLSNEWYSELTIRYNCFPRDLEHTTLSFIKETSESRLVFTIEHNKEESRASASLIKRF